jgi:hypothetical protein
MKRVVIVLAALIAFQTPISPATLIGASVGMGGTLIYSLVN